MAIQGFFATVWKNRAPICICDSAISNANSIATSTATSTAKIIILLLSTVALSACSVSQSGDNDASSAGVPALSQSNDNQQSLFADPIDVVQTINSSDNDVLADAQNSTDLDFAVNELASGLETEFEFTNEGDVQEIVPTTGWICEDVFKQNRTYFFYPEGVLDPGRKVAIERTLIADSMFNDVRFFWSVNGADSILLTSAIFGEQGGLLSSGLQYDMNSIVFANVDSVPSFTANSVLRGQLVCANFNLR